MAGRPGLYMNIHKKRRRIAAGSGEKMRKPGSKGAPTEKAFRMSKRTAKKGLGLFLWFQAFKRMEHQLDDAVVLQL